MIWGMSDKMTFSLTAECQLCDTLDPMASRFLDGMMVVITLISITITILFLCQALCKVLNRHCLIPTIMHKGLTLFYPWGYEAHKLSLRSHIEKGDVQIHLFDFKALQLFFSLFFFFCEEG